MKALQAARVIGIVHRIKETKDQEKQPTMVAISAGKKTVAHKLATETDELDFLLNRFPVKWRDVTSHQEDLKPFQWRHLKWRKLGETERIEEFADPHVRFTKKKGAKVYEVVDQVPEVYEGLKAGDAVAMYLGGTGDRLAAALSRRGEEISARVFRIPSMVVKDRRGEASKDDDCFLLATMLTEKLASGAKDMRPFYLVRPRDRLSITLKEAVDLRQRAMENRIACGNQIYSATIGTIFLSEEGMYPDGEIEDICNKAKANDTILAGLLAEEKRRELDLKRIIRATPMWPLFEKLKGAGPMTAARLIAAIADIRRFKVEPDPDAIAASYRESKKLEALGKFVEDQDKVMDRVTAATTPFQLLQMVRSWKQQNGKMQEAIFLTQAIACHKQRAKLRRKAKDRGMYKLRAFCGVFVKQGGKYKDVPAEKSFPRRRTGEQCNWHPLARQAFYLLCEQFNRRPITPWGQKLLHKKALRRVAHPEPVQVDVIEKGKPAKKWRHTDGHIHQAGIWKTATQLCDWLFNEWTRLEEETQRREDAGEEFTSLPLAPETDLPDVADDDTDVSEEVDDAA